MSFKKMLIIPVALAFMAVGAGSANAQVVAAPMLAVQLATSGLTNPLVIGQNATLARLVLDTTGSNTGVRVASLPLSLTTGSGAVASSLTNCRVYNEANSSVALNSGSNVSGTLASGMNTMTLDNPIILPANTVTTLDVRCDIASNLVTGGTYQFSLNTADVVATDPATGVPATVVLRGVSVPVVVPPVVVPTVPNTGAGGMASTNVAIILGSLAAATFGLAYARKAVR